MFFTQAHKKSRTTALAWLGTATALSLLLTACGGSKPASEATVPADSKDPVTITFMQVMNSGALKTSLEKITKDFMAQNPNITVDLQDQPDYGTLNTKINAQTAAKTPPTIAQVYENWAQPLADSGAIVPLDNYVKTSTDYPNFYEGIKKDLKLADGKTWMWPFNKSVVVQYYNQDMVPQAPKTWDEFASTAKKVSNNKVVAVSTDPGSSSAPAGGTAWFDILAQSFGEPVFSEDGTPQFDKDGALKAMEYLKGLKDAGALALGTNYPGQTALAGGTGAFDISSVASYQFNLKAIGGKFPMGVAALPEGPKGPANQLAGTNIAIFSQASDAQKTAAWKYLQFLTSPQEMAFWSSTTGYLPVNKAATEEPDFKAYAQKNPWVTSAADQLNTATALPAKSYVNQASGALSQAITEVITRGADPKEALGKAQEAALKAQKNAE